VLEATGEPPQVLGYCMGGLLALALAQRRRRDVAALALMAVPWDFAADAAPAAALLPLAGPALMQAVALHGELPTDLIQAMFYSLDPMLVVRKFLGFAAMDQASPEARAFVALEDWLNDGVPLAGPVAQEALLGWYGANEPAGLRWRIAGRTVEPSRVAVPALALIPSRDRIVPPASARALAAALPAATALTVPLGHIGMVVSARAERRAWIPLADWLESN
jgi:polyhydroxyalkanoate synthase subunit PhaC